MRKPSQDAGRMYLQARVNANSGIDNVNVAIDRILELVAKEYEDDGGDKGLLKKAGVGDKYVAGVIEEMRDASHHIGKKDN